MADPFAPGRLGPLELRNRVIKAATFEGMTPGGVPSAALTDHHRGLARGGVGMTTVAYCAVDEGARTFPDQLWLHDEAVERLRTLTQAVRDEGAGVSLQLSHCGFFSKLRRPDGTWPRGPSLTINKYGLASGLAFARAMGTAEIEALPNTFAEAVSRAEAAGFDAVELHLGHGYLLSQFLSPATNRRSDRWGGSLENRMRLPLAVARAVVDRVGGRLAVLAKINTEDGFRGGATVADALELAVRLEEAGVDAIVTSGGFTSKNPIFLMRGERPLPELIAVETNPLQRTALRVLGPAVLREFPFEETYFRAAGLRLVERISIPVVLLGGVVSRANLEAAMEDGFGFVQMARALIADPDLVERMRVGEVVRTRCTACNRCMAEMDAGGVRCVLDDGEPPTAKSRAG